MTTIRSFFLISTGVLVCMFLLAACSSAGLQNALYQDAKASSPSKVGLMAAPILSQDLGISKDSTVPPTTSIHTAVTAPTTQQQLLPASYWTIFISDDDQDMTLRCDGVTIMVKGNNNTLTLSGTCSGLIVRGDNNQISLERPTEVTDSGNENSIMLSESPATTQSDPTTIVAGELQDNRHQR
jgi:hypothetical protein